MADEPYQPIACADYDIYEIAIMQGRLLALEWTSLSDETVKQIVKPLQLQIQHGAEYLIYEFNNDMHEKNSLRLDKIAHAKILTEDL